jgi:thiol-disulfide isomerase/thioredoxin
MQKFKNRIMILGAVWITLSFYACHAQNKVVKAVETSVANIDTFVSKKNLLGDPLLDFKAFDAKGNTFSQENLTKGQPIMFVLFNPSCGHCQELLVQVRDNIALYENVNIVFLTGKPLKSVLPNYVVNVKVDKMKEINVVSDESEVTMKLFEYQGIPQIMLYDKNHKLKFIYYKEATNKQILTKLKS